jgi:hypothetical protein
MNNDKLTELGAEIAEAHFELSKTFDESKMIALAEKLIREQSGFINHTHLVDSMLRQGVFEFDDISCIVDNGDDFPEFLEFLQFYAIVSDNDYFIDCLKAVGESLLINDYGVWWCRPTYGQALSLDLCFQMIAAHYFKKGWLK